MVTKDSNAAENRCWNRKLVFTGNDFVERDGVHGSDTSEEFARHAIAACGGYRVMAVGGNHIIDCCHVDCILKFH